MSKYRMQAVIYVRSNVDYDAITTSEDFSNQPDTGGPNSLIRKLPKSDLISTWNSIFSITYPNYRKRIRDIAEHCLGNTGLPIFRADFKKLMEWNPGEEIIVFPTDDDDWFRHDLGSTIDFFDEKTNILYWPFVKFDTTDDTSLLDYNIPMLKSYNACCYIKTNNYAIRRSYLCNLSNAYRLLHYHSDAYDTFTRYAKEIPSDFKTINESLSVCNRHAGSLSYLNVLMREGNFEQKLRYFCYREKHLPQISGNLKWAEPYMEMMEDLNQRLRVKIF